MKSCVSVGGKWLLEARYDQMVSVFLKQINFSFIGSPLSDELFPAVCLASGVHFVVFICVTSEIAGQSYLTMY